MNLVRQNRYTLYKIKFIIEIKQYIWIKYFVETVNSKNLDRLELKFRIFLLKVKRDQKRNKNKTGFNKYLNTSIRILTYELKLCVRTAQKFSIFASFLHCSI